jgi:transcriptional antiterminator RfaH
MQAWYAVQTKPRRESLAEEHLARQGYDVHLPLLESARRRRGRWRPVVEPLFPGYLFVKLDLRHDDWAPIRSSRGVATGLVRFGGVPRSVPEGVVEGLLAAGTGAGGALRRDHPFRAGDRVEIVAGPLAGLRAVFLAPTGAERVQLLLEMLGRQNRVVLSRHHLTPAP